MRILIDGVAFENSYQIGIQRYFREMLGRVALTEQVEITTSQRPRVPLPEHCVKRSRISAGSPTAPFDLFQSTRFSLSPIPQLPQVLTIYDMIPECHWRYEGTDMSAEIEAKRAAGEAARRIICISHATADSVRSIHPQWADKLRVIHLGADHLSPDRRSRGAKMKLPASRRPWRQWMQNYRSRRAAAELVGRRYALFVGDRGEYKNFKVILEAMTQPQWPQDLLLAVVGHAARPQEAAELEHKNLTQRVKFLGRVSDDRLWKWYAQAECFLFPSRAEGFGFPLLEAQLAGAPVVCSDIPVFHEVGGGAAVFCDPADPAAWAAAAANSRAQSEAGRKQAAAENLARFRWDDCAARTLEVYREIVAEGRHASRH
jgi:glycosyltransferase involved in cell wall biosynthesis